MAKSKLTLIVDGNWLLMSRLSVISGKYTTDEEICGQLKLMLVKSTNIVLHTFRDIDNIIFVADCGSWRSKLEIPACLHHETEGRLSEYKGNRQKSAEINWDMVFGAMDDYMAALQTAGITTCREKDVEGDDWCCWWSKRLNAEDTSCIIWTQDKDLQQLVNINPDKCFTVWWNRLSGLVCPEYDESQMDFLFNMKFSQNETLFKNVCRTAGRVTSIRPEDIVTEKIFKGDKSDNIIPLALRTAKSGSPDKKFKIASKDVPYGIDLDSDDAIRAYFTGLFGQKSYKGRVTETVDEAMEHFRYNRNLVRLTRTEYPDYIMETFSRYGSCGMSKDLTQVEAGLQAQANGLGALLDTI